MLRTPLLCLVILAASPLTASAATYYIGRFTGSTPADDSSCGTGMGAPPAAHPCATLAHWTQNRNLGANGDTVRIAPGTYTSTSGYHCFDMAKTGVTYRGSKADGTDTTDRTLVVVSGATGSPGSPCRGTVVKFVSGTSTNMTLRDLTVNECANADNGHCLQFSALPGAGTLSGLTIDNIRVTKAPTTGIWVGAYEDYVGGPFSEPFNASNVTIKNSEFDGNCFSTNMNGAGIQIAAVNGGVISGNRIHDNVSCQSSITGTVPNRTCTRHPLPPNCAGGDCNCDGIHMGGRGFQVFDNQVYNNEEDGIDISPNGAADDCPKTSSRFHTFRTNQLHDNGVHNFSMNGCAHDLTFYNNIVWGFGTGINQYECAGYNSSFYNNTVYTSVDPALFVYTTMWPVTFKNNVFVSNAATAVWIDAGSTNADSTWSNNVVWNRGSGFVAQVDFVTEAGTYPNCTTGSGTNCCTDPDGPKSIGTIPARGRSTSVNYTKAQLATWTSDGAAGFLFGPETGTTDRWALPAFVDAAAATAAGLHLQATDAVARDRGATLTAVTTDFDGRARPQGPAYDVGACEVDSLTIAAPQLLSVTPVP